MVIEFRIRPHAMKIVSACVMIAGLGLLPMPVAHAEEAAPNFSASELDNLVAPVALYPDPILSQAMTAATFPDQVQAAKAWSDSHQSLTGEALAQAMADANLEWDPSVQALIPFPSVLETMTRDSSWLTNFGNAVLAQRGDTMDAVQRMRKTAQDAGNLQSSEYIKVENTSSTVIEIQPADPQVIYVPTYDPEVVYEPQSSSSGNVAAAALFGFAAGVMVAEVFDDDWYGGCGFYWGSHTVVVHNSAWGRTWGNRYTYHPPYRSPRPVVIDRDVNIHTGDINIGNEVNIGGDKKVNVKGGDRTNVNVQGGDKKVDVGGGDRNVDRKGGSVAAGGDRSRTGAAATQAAGKPQTSTGTASRGYKQNPDARSKSAMSGIQNGKTEAKAGQRGQASTGGRAASGRSGAGGKAGGGAKAKPSGKARGGR